MKSTFVVDDNGLTLFCLNKFHHVIPGDITYFHPGKRFGWVIANKHNVLRNAYDELWEDAGCVEEKELTCLIDLDGDVFAGSREAELYRVSKDSATANESFSASPDRESWFTPWGGAPDTRTLCLDDKGALYVNVHVGGILKSTDQGKSWTTIIDIIHDIHDMTFSAAESRLYAVGAAGAFESSDYGENWDQYVDGFEDVYCRAVAHTENYVFVSSSNGPRGDKGVVYRRLKGETGAFERCSSTLPEYFHGNVNTRCMAAKGKTVAVGFRNTLYISGDEGESWKLESTRFNGIRQVVMT